MNFVVGIKLYKLSKLGVGGGNLDKIQTNSSFFVRTSLKPSSFRGAGPCHNGWTRERTFVDTKHVPLSELNITLSTLQLPLVTSLLGKCKGRRFSGMPGHTILADWEISRNAAWWEGYLNKELNIFRNKTANNNILCSMMIKPQIGACATIIPYFIYSALSVNLIFFR